jgi:hypothetical protein
MQRLQHRHPLLAQASQDGQALRGCVSQRQHALVIYGLEDGPALGRHEVAHRRERAPRAGSLASRSVARRAASQRVDVALRALDAALSFHLQDQQLGLPARCRGSCAAYVFRCSERLSTVSETAPTAPKASCASNRASAMNAAADGRPANECSIGCCFTQ